jgi:hypothetical protein
VSAIERVLERLERARRSGDGWTARCPAHDDHTPSLGIDLGSDDRILICCHAGCRIEDVLAAIGLGLADLFENETTPPIPGSRVVGREPTGAEWDAIWGRLRREADRRTETYLRGEEPSRPRRIPTSARAPGVPLTRGDFDTDADHAAYEAWRHDVGRLRP